MPQNSAKAEPAPRAMTSLVIALGSRPSIFSMAVAGAHFPVPQSPIWMFCTTRSDTCRI